MTPSNYFKLMNLQISSKIIQPKIQNLIFIPVLLSISAILLSEYIIYSFPIALILVLIFVFGEKFVITFVIVSLFTLVGDISKSLRVLVQLIDICLLGYLFLKRYGFQINNYPKIPGPVISVLVLYYISMILSVTLSDYTQSGVILIARQTVFFVIVYFFFSLIKNKNDVKNIFVSLIFAASILAAASIVFFILDGSVFFDLTASFRSRTSSLISNPNAVTTFYMVSFPFLVAFLFLIKDKSTKFLLWSLILLLSFGLLLTMSRSAILGIIISLLIIFFLLRKKYFTRLLAILTSIVTLVIVFGAFSDILLIILRVEAGLTGRNYLWTISFDIIKDHFVFGIGPGAYKYVWLDYFPVMLSSWTGQTLVALHNMAPDSNLSHNFYLLFFSDMGILGLLTALSLTFIYFKIGFKTLFLYKTQPNDTYYLIVALFASGASVFVRVFSDSIGLMSYGAITADLPFWLVFISIIHFYSSQKLKNQNV